MANKNRLDRLSALVARFALDVTPADENTANLRIATCNGSSQPTHVWFSAINTLPSSLCKSTEIVFEAQASWGGSANPLINALPVCIEVNIVDDLELQSLATLLALESRAQRCGSGSVINRLGEVLLVCLLRAQLSSGETDVGLLGGLADPRLSQTIVAMHEHPERHWRIEQLAEIAGLSTSRFADRFATIVGQTPMAYLRVWRMVLARQDIENGDRIQSVANRYGYRSGEAMSRAFRRHYGMNPIKMRTANQ